MENIYKNMKTSGVLSIIGGISAMAVGLMVLIIGALMLKNKSEILF